MSFWLWAMLSLFVWAMTYYWVSSRVFRAVKIRLFGWLKERETWLANKGAHLEREMSEPSSKVPEQGKSRNRIVPRDKAHWFHNAAVAVNYVRGGLDCRLCMPQWFAFGGYWWATGLAPWEWGATGLGCCGCGSGAVGVGL